MTKGPQVALILLLKKRHTLLKYKDICLEFGAVLGRCGTERSKSGPPNDRPQVFHLTPGGAQEEALPCVHVCVG